MDIQIFDAGPLSMCDQYAIILHYALYLAPETAPLRGDINFRYSIYESPFFDQLIKKLRFDSKVDQKK